MSERLPRDEAELQEQADGALPQHLGEARDVMDGKEVELAIRVESVLEDQGHASRHPQGGRRACAPGAPASARYSSRARQYGGLGRA